MTTGTGRVLPEETTYRRQLEEALAASEERYRRLFDEDLAGRIVVTPAGRVIDSNDALAGMLGVPHAGLLVGRMLAEFFPDSLRLDKLLAAVRAEERVEAEVELTRADGGTIQASATFGGAFDPAGQLLSIRGRLAEVTKVEQLKQQLLGVQRMEAIGRLAGGLAHEFNNILTVIGGHSERLIELLGPRDSAGNSAVAIKEATDRATSLTRQLLAFSRRQVFQLRPVALHRLIAEARPLIERAIGEAIDVRVDLPAALPDIVADAAQLQDVVMNLALNARESMPKGGTLTIRVDTLNTGEHPPRERPWIRVGSYVRLTMADTGAGMDAIARAHVFEPFFTTRQLGIGSGLGLATVYGIVKQSSGYIWVESDVGRGASFTILLPVLAMATDVLASADPAAARLETVLVVEEDDSIRGLVADSLRRRGYHVLDAPSGPRAIDAFIGCRSRIHLLLTEIAVGAAGGPEIAGRLKAVDPLLQVLYMSGSRGASSGEQPAILGMPFIQKPFALQALADKVREVLDTGEGRG
ncbi:MAG TPA: ATP-binding protein [Candidatus Limnocylindrales bacterium]|nr:ATP-binding protein [Candidatus Limnocylindrales bacterium]